MSLAIQLTALTEDTPERLVVHSGVMYRNINIAELEAADGTFADAINPENTWTQSGRTFTPEPFGATKQGFTIETGMPVEPIPDVDGALGPTVGLMEVTSFAPTFAGNLLEMADYRKMKEGLAAADASLTASGLWKIEPRAYVTKNDHLGNLAVFCQTSNPNTNHLWLAVLFNPIGGASSIQLTRGANVLPVTYRGCASLSASTQPPIRFYVPRNAADGSGS
jgi:hypothetical protein